MTLNTKIGLDRAPVVSYTCTLFWGDIHHLHQDLQVFSGFFSLPPFLLHFQNRSDFLPTIKESIWQHLADENTFNRS